ncbi:MAG: hypothetical protein FWH05_05060 [Oscillospiraceae bacterium]|nr:hypothetical protein [Oscillospiraceae bacterium]
MTNQHPHYGHRQRKKEEFLLRGIEGRPEHEILEFLLFYAIPQKDTNPLAHQLIARFGSLTDVLNAPFEELIQIDGVKENAACLICFLRALSKVYLTNEQKSVIEIRDAQSMFRYCKALFIGAKTEEIHMLFFDDRLNLLGEEKICNGTFDGVSVSMRMLIEAAIRAKSSAVAIVHNHPNSTSMPSKNDLNATAELWKLLTALDIDFVDHVIIAKDGDWSMRHNGTMQFIWNS